MDDPGWWTVGVPKPVRLKVSQRCEDDNQQRGSKENYFDLVDYSKIALENWSIFEPILAYGKSGNKAARLAWLNFVNEKRNIVSHVSSGINLSREELDQLEEYDRWFENHNVPVSEKLSDTGNDE